MKLRYTPQAILDLEEIKDYISFELQNPEAAKNIIHSIAKDTATLKEKPFIGVELRKKNRAGYQRTGFDFRKVYGDLRSRRICFYPSRAGHASGLSANDWNMVISTAVRSFLVFKAATEKMSSLL